MDKPHIDPEPDRRYIIEDHEAGDCIDSAVVIEATDRYVRLRWDMSGLEQWYLWESFQPDGEEYPHLEITQQLETPR